MRLTSLVAAANALVGISPDPNNLTCYTTILEVQENAFSFVQSNKPDIPFTLLSAEVNLTTDRSTITYQVNMTERNTTYTNLIPGWIFGVVHNQAYFQAPIKSFQNNSCAKALFLDLERGVQAVTTIGIGTQKVTWGPYKLVNDDNGAANALPIIWLAAFAILNNFII
mmetsp:Transcript_3402/g.4916  ORF Transcript_3402/g.4916 Transcript_3402/m.4916 type:complete len:168 (+) Transcript_3402:89-592(+)